MRPRSLVLIVSLVVGLLFGVLGRALDVGALDVVAGFGWLVALVVAASMLPWWSRIIPRVPPMPGLFVRPAPDERWCAGCGSVTVKAGPCAACAEVPRERKARR